MDVEILSSGAQNGVSTYPATPSLHDAGRGTAREGDTTHVTQQASTPAAVETATNLRMIPKTDPALPHSRIRFTRTSTKRRKARVKRRRRRVADLKRRKTTQLPGSTPWWISSEKS